MYITVVGTECIGVKEESIQTANIYFMWFFPNLCWSKFYDIHNNI